MARIRTIKPEFWGHPKTARISRDARLLFLGLLNEADDDGRLLGAPKRIAGNVFPNDEDVTASRVTRWLGELEHVGLIIRYIVDKVVYVALPGFTEHQKISHPTPSRLPNPPAETLDLFTTFSGTAPECFCPDLGNGSRKGKGSSGGAAPDPRIQVLVGGYVDDFRAERNGKNPSSSWRASAGLAVKRALADGTEPGDVAKCLGVIAHEGKNPSTLQHVLADFYAGRPRR